MGREGYKTDNFATCICYRHLLQVFVIDICYMYLLHTFATSICYRHLLYFYAKNMITPGSICAISLLCFCCLLTETLYD